MWREPRPASADDIPIWFGGKFTPRLVRRVVDLGDGWIPFQGYGESLGEISEKVQLLKQALRDANRDPHTLDVAYWMRTLRRPDCLALVPARRPRVIRSPGITRYSRLCSLAARPGRTECARSCRRARAARGWHPDSASDRQLRESGRLGCLDPVGAALAGIRNVGCGPPAPLPSRCLWLERSVLVSVLLGQVLMFWQDQLGAVVQLGWNLLLLGALRYAIRQEEARLVLARESATRSLPETATRR